MRSIMTKPPSLLSYVLPSKMVAPVEEFANIPKFPPHTQSTDLLNTHYPNTNAPPPSTNHRGRSLTVNGNFNSQRLPSEESNITTSSLDYAERMEVETIKASWTDQVNMEEDISPPPPNQLQKQIPEAEAIPSQTMSSLHSAEYNTIEPCPNTEPTAIPYQTNGPADPNLWDGNFTPISLLGVDEYLNGDAKNISCSLQRIAIFMKQRSLTN